MTNYKQLKSEDEIPYETQSSAEHECIPLKQRLKMLRARALLQNPKEIIISDISPSGDDAVVVKKENDLCESIVHQSDGYDSEGRYGRASCEQNQHGRVHMIESCPLQEKLLSDIEYTTVSDDSVIQLPNCQRLLSADTVEISDSIFDDLDHVVLKERQRMLLSRRELVGFRGPAMQRCGGRDICDKRSSIGASNGYVYASHHSLNDFTIARMYQDQQITLTESQNYKNQQMALPPKLKVEPLDDDIQVQNKHVVASQCIGSNLSLKSEAVNTSEIFQDIIDHMLLGDRMRLLASRSTCKTIMYQSLENLKPCANDHKPTLFESSKPLLVKQTRKKRKTVTESIETALEEDAPGLLKVLMEKGVLVDEIKLYGETLDESLIEDTFSELQHVIAKSLLKFAPIRCGKGEKVSYCLACLISLVEQARYLRVRKWPVEWGWCRDLQSFIFVFKKHNRIVLERPEYGYATYFFELVDGLPVNWQIKRLVTTMKLSSCSRMTLIENRALRVGDDVTEGEARVLMEYGWMPDSGVGTMLNYCDRVVHDRKNEYESDSSEWRSKIGKLLTDGYNGGIIVPNHIPNKVMEYSASISKPSNQLGPVIQGF